MNPIQTLLASFFRHVIVTGLFCLATLMSLPEAFRSQIEDAANWVAPILVSFVAWVITKYGKPFLTKIGFLSCLAAFLSLLPSCNVVGSAITGQAIPSTPVQRTGHDEAPVVHISSSDLALAEKAAEEAISLGKTPPVYGLYNAGYLAEVARQTVIEATK